jgi:UTP-glucose-1-phosphate uridylyltransferase
MFPADLVERRQQLVAGHHHLKPTKDTAILCLQDVDRKDVAKYGIVEIDLTHDAKHPKLKKVKGLVEKPKPSEAPSTQGVSHSLSDLHYV